MEKGLEDKGRSGYHIPHPHLHSCLMKTTKDVVVIPTAPLPSGLPRMCWEM